MFTLYETILNETDEFGVIDTETKLFESKSEASKYLKDIYNRDIFCYDKNMSEISESYLKKK